ncbi:MULTISPECIES: ABC transporter permease [unclassified Beijerinckia]|uniref:ABC transporter permease n=1 Tax=unclassified Beijerinckia TaxID=2638183 RepID=UPI0008943ECD|nr:MULTISPECIES: ABC transporter permease [unclassified Beijerinckia]MDH7795973.1 ABC-type nitrate/sulfonate/bicarbonate transport system permease component [Beijerinckia sp. GAS462]SEC24471.1 NitT/TauT family transport system permease protein [Beijerinckia sp. 28-YEA-48]
MNRHAIWIIRLSLVAAFFLMWEIAVRSHVIDPLLAPPPSQAIIAAGGLLGDSIIRQNIWATLGRVATAFAIGAPAAILVGFVVGESRRLDRWLGPIIRFALNIPQSIFLPIFLLMFGIGFAQKVAFGVTHVFFVLAVTTIAAVHSIPRELVAASRSFGASTAQIYWKVYTPAMLPTILTGLRLAMIFNVGSVLLAEMYSSRDGIGVLLFGWSEAGKVLEATAMILLLGVATVAFNEAIRVWETRLGGWRLSA